MKKPIIAIICILTVLLSACAPAEKTDLTHLDTDPVKETTGVSGDDSENEEMKALIQSIIQQVIDKDISETVINELEALGLDSETIKVFTEIVMEDGKSELFKDGVYTGTEAGHNGDITVEVTVYEGKIIYIDVIEHSETAPLLDDVFKLIPIEVMREQSMADIDIVAGATESSNGYIAAVTTALEHAK